MQNFEKKFKGDISNYDELVNHGPTLDAWCCISLKSKINKRITKIYIPSSNFPYTLKSHYFL